VTLPHPEIANRFFVLQPLAEIGPDMLHPVIQKTSLEMLQDFIAHNQNDEPGSKVQITNWTTTDDEVSE
jgi:7,8-dihydro-6-hydroxymethylpterin-pyrophosphokinase